MLITHTCLIKQLLNEGVAIVHSLLVLSLRELIEINHFHFLDVLLVDDELEGLRLELNYELDSLNHDRESHETPRLWQDQYLIRFSIRQSLSLTSKWLKLGAL